MKPKNESVEFSAQPKKILIFSRCKFLSFFTQMFYKSRKMRILILYCLIVVGVCLFLFLCLCLHRSICFFYLFLESASRTQISFSFDLIFHVKLKAFNPNLSEGIFTPAPLLLFL